MKIISNLIKRYANIQAPNKTLKKAFISAVEDCVNITIESKDVEIHKKIIRVNTSSVIKNEIRFNQRDILNNISEQVGDTKAVTAIF